MSREARAAVPRAPVRRAIALIIEQPGQRGAPDGVDAEPRWLIVRRPAGDPDLPGVWGLPAGSRAEDEGDEALVRRIGRDKLGVELADLGALAGGHLDRDGYQLRMRVHAARLVSGAPSVPQPAPGVTQYSDWRWDAPAALRDGAARGSLCCRLALDAAV